MICPPPRLHAIGNSCESTPATAMQKRQRGTRTASCSAARTVAVPHRSACSMRAAAVTAAIGYESFAHLRRLKERGSRADDHHQVSSVAMLESAQTEEGPLASCTETRCGTNADQRLHANRRGTVAQRVSQSGQWRFGKALPKSPFDQGSVGSACPKSKLYARSLPLQASHARPGITDSSVRGPASTESALRISERTCMQGGDGHRFSRTRVVITRGSVDSLARKVAHVLRAAILAHLPSTRQTLADARPLCFS